MTNSIIYGDAGRLTITPLNGGFFGGLMNPKLPVPALLHPEHQGYVATLCQLRKVLGSHILAYDDPLVWNSAKNLMSRTVCAFESELPLTCLPTDSGKAYIKGASESGNTFILGSRDSVLKAACGALANSGFSENEIKVKLETPGVFAAMESNYDIVDSSPVIRNYTILADNMHPKQLSYELKFSFGKLTGQSKELGGKTGAFASLPLGLDVGRCHYVGPGPAILLLNISNEHGKTSVSPSVVHIGLDLASGYAQYAPISKPQMHYTIY